MKNFITSSLFILAFSLAPLAHAMPYWAAAEMSAYSKDKSAGSDASKASYSGYYCTVETAKQLFSSSSGSKISSYLSKDYSTFMTAKGYSSADGVTAFDSVSFGDGEYALLDYTGSPFLGSEYVAIAFYGSGNVNGYQVFDSAELTPNGQIVFKSGGGWEDGPEQDDVPEPTSGVLTLLGLAGLALKRKRNKA